MYYAKSTNGFYAKEIHDTIPHDVVEISDDLYNSLLTAQSAGKAITADANGSPIAIDPVVSQNDRINGQIRALEAAMTKRRIREAIKDPAWMENLDSQIAALRAQLT